MEKQPVYVEWIKYHFSAIVGLLSYLVAFAVDHAGEITIRALPVVAPLPNAIGMYKTSMDALEFSHWQAFLFAAAIEISIFALAEIAVVLWDAWQAGDSLYEMPFKLMAFVTGFVAVLIIVLVATLEVYGASGHWILAALPLISVASAVGLCMKRYHKRRSEGKRNELVELIEVLNLELTGVRFELAATNSRILVLGEVEQKAARLEAHVEVLVGKLADRDAEIIRLRSEVERLRNDKKSSVLEPKIEPKIEPASEAETSESGDVTSRRIDVLIELINKRKSINKSAMGRKHGVSDKAIAKDIEWLISSGYWVNGSTQQPTPAGLALAGVEFLSN